MMDDLLEDQIFVKLMKVHIQECLELLFNKGVNFSILTNLEMVKFDPALPSDIMRDIRPISAFTLAGYTYDSAVLSENFLKFEAGFGKENIGSIVSVPLGAILQIVVSNMPILVNSSIPTKEMNDKREEYIQKSTQALLSNPKNKNLLNK